jgi:hypothetical protein
VECSRVTYGGTLMIFIAGPSVPSSSSEVSSADVPGEFLGGRGEGEGACLCPVLVSTTTGTLDLTWRGTFCSLRNATRRTGSEVREERREERRKIRTKKRE